MSGLCWGVETERLILKETERAGTLLYYNMRTLLNIGGLRNENYPSLLQLCLHFQHFSRCNLQLNKVILLDCV